MHLTYRNVNVAFRELIRSIWLGSRTDGPFQGQINLRTEASRNGPVLVVDEPVLITYTHPQERVLFNKERDANPFFHLYEALWMLAGRNDVSSVGYYAKQMHSYSDDGKTLNGAYGYRWRHARTNWNFKVDQLTCLINHLKDNPTSRRAVLQMWNVEDDLLRIGPDKEDSPLKVMSKDTCCNLSVMFSIRDGERIEDESKYHPHTGTFYTTKKYLDITVTNRSNDLIWGALGANYVHFTMLQEYMAAHLGVEIGKYHHFTNNLHVYTETNSGFKPREWLREYEPTDNSSWIHYNRWDRPKSTMMSLVKNPEVFDNELHSFTYLFDGTKPEVYQEGYDLEFREPFFETVARQMCQAFYWYKNKQMDKALIYANKIQADDWRIACIQWLEKRVKL